ncbi:MAG: CAMK/CAMKL protein kinase [Amphiamblys sp. WSBS2006]|nr:MAG: CAMK/CAMKL protein kinase [Amphiamblys sp. WSBS2006]
MEIPTNVGIDENKEERFQSYKIINTIGKGSYGVVKKCVHIPTGRVYAIKFVEKGRITKPVQIVRLKREITILKLLNHPNIVKIFGAHETEKELAIVMEYVEGIDLFEHIRAQRKLSERDSVGIFRGLVSALHYLHSNNIVHRDVKPENIVLLKDSSHVKLIDFGFSTMYHPKKNLSTNCGSPLYASPEIVSGRRYVGPEVDVWSAGVVLFVMLHGRLPFDDRDTKKTYARIRYGIFTVDRERLSAEAVNILLQMIKVESVLRADIAGVLQHPWVDPLQERGWFLEAEAMLAVHFDYVFLSAKAVQRIREVPGYDDAEENEDAVRNDDESPQRALYRLIFCRLERRFGVLRQENRFLRLFNKTA